MHTNEKKSTKSNCMLGTTNSQWLIPPTSLRDKWRFGIILSPFPDFLLSLQGWDILSHPLRLQNTPGQDHSQHGITSTLLSHSRVICCHRRHQPLNLAPPTPILNLLLAPPIIVYTQQFLTGWGCLCLCPTCGISSQPLFMHY